MNSPAPEPAGLPLPEQIFPRFLENDPQAGTKAVEMANVRLLERLFTAALQGEFDTIIEHFADDIDWEVVGPAVMPFYGSARGKKEAGEALRRNLSAYQIIRSEIRDVVAQGNQVVMVVHEWGIFKTAGRASEVDYIMVFTFVDGKLVKFREYADTLALKQGLTRSES